MVGAREPRFDLEAHERYRQDAIYFADNFHEIRAQHPDRFVAVADQRVISHARGMRLLLLKLQGVEIDPAVTFIDNTFSAAVRARAHETVRSLARSTPRRR